MDDDGSGTLEHHELLAALQVGRDSLSSSASAAAAAAAVAVAAAVVERL